MIRVSINMHLRIYGKGFQLIGKSSYTNLFPNPN